MIQSLSNNSASSPNHLNSILVNKSTVSTPPQSANISITPRLSSTVSSDTTFYNSRTNSPRPVLNSSSQFEVVNLKSRTSSLASTPPDLNHLSSAKSSTVSSPHQSICMNHDSQLPSVVINKSSSPDSSLYKSSSPLSRENSLSNHRENSLSNHVLSGSSHVLSRRLSTVTTVTTGTASSSRWAKAAWILGITGTQMNVSILIYLLVPVYY